jgi:hypothetical protein
MIENPVIAIASLCRSPRLVGVQVIIALLKYRFESLLR